MDSILGSSAVWTRHAPRKYDMPRSGISWHKPYLVKLDQNGLRYFVELFGSWGFKFPTPQWRILVISVISLEYLLEYLWYQLIDIYIYINWYYMIHWKTQAFWHSACLRIRSDHPIRFTCRPRCGRTGEMLALQKGPPRCHGDATGAHWVTGISRSRVMVVLFPEVITVVSGWWVVMGCKCCKCCKCCDPSGSKKS